MVIKFFPRTYWKVSSEFRKEYCKCIVIFNDHPEGAS